MAHENQGGFVIVPEQQLNELIHEIRELKQEMRRQIDHENKKLVDIKDIVGLLTPHWKKKNGKHISEKTVRRWFTGRQLINRNAGGKMMCTVGDLKDFLGWKYGINI